MTDIDQEWRRSRLSAACEKAGSREELGRRLGYKSGAFIQQMAAGIRPVTEKTVAAVEALQGFRGWFDRPRLALVGLDVGAVPIDSLSTHTPAQSGGALAHDMSLARNTLSLPKVTWEQLMSADLNEPFELEVIDDALGPDIFRGCTVRLDPGRPPQAGRPVLVKDGAGRFYLRDYQVAGAGRWQAVARQRGYAPLDSDADGLQLVAVMRGFDWP